MHKPNQWVVVEYKGDYRILGSWSGSYLYGGSWRLSSGITRIVDSGDEWIVHNYSGSLYHCFKESEMLGSHAAGIFHQIKDMGGRRIDLADIVDRFKGDS